MYTNANEIWKMFKIWVENTNNLHFFGRTKFEVRVARETDREVIVEFEYCGTTAREILPKQLPEGNLVHVCKIVIAKGLVDIFTKRFDYEQSCYWLNRISAWV